MALYSAQTDMDQNSPFVGLLVINALAELAAARD